LFKLGLGEFGFASTVREKKSSFVVLFGSAMVDQALDNKIDGLEDVTSRFVIGEFNVAELENFTYEIKFRLCYGMEKSTVSVI
jgi:hypothetical protein